MSRSARAFLQLRLWLEANEGYIAPAYERAMWERLRFEADGLIQWYAA